MKDLDQAIERARIGMSRRGFLTGAGIGALGLTGASSIGCAPQSGAAETKMPKGDGGSETQAEARPDDPHLDRDPMLTVAKGTAATGEDNG